MARDMNDGWERHSAGMGTPKDLFTQKGKNKGGRVRKRGTYEEMMIEGENRKKSKLLKKMSEGPGQRGITAPERLTLLTSISSVLLQRKRERESQTWSSSMY